MPTRRECANAIRALSIDAIDKANSGHPGAPLGMADMGEALWGHFLKHNPANPKWPDRDIFILSNGHASMLLYSLLHLTGYDLSLDDIKNFRQWQSKTPGHPERGLTPGVEMTTGPLGQGIASAVGFALAEALLAKYFNRPNYKIVDHYTYAFCGDGCLMEGVSYEAFSLAGTWKLGKLIVFYDNNGISIDGNINGWFTENIEYRFEACHWHVIGPIDGHDYNALDAAIIEAKKETSRPSIIICKTHIGYGSPQTDTQICHGSPFGEKISQITKENLSWKEKPFSIPQEIYDALDCRKKGAESQKQWDDTFKAYAKAYPELANEFLRRANGNLPQNWPALKEQLLKIGSEVDKPLATRVSSKNCIEFLLQNLPELIGGSADLSASIGTITKDSIPVDFSDFTGNYLYYGVREFAMGAIMNGLALHGGFIPYAGTFLAFSDQAKNALRLSALMKLGVIWILTHDSIGVGEDGSTHQPIEQISSLRLLPDLRVWRPCDQEETVAGWISALQSRNLPTCLILSRQKLPQIKRSPAQVADIQRGGYILRDTETNPEIILIATGSEVSLALEAAENLNAQNISTRVVSMPCCEIFDAQPETWKEHVLPKKTRMRIVIEASATDWWYKYAGLDGKIIGMNSFGASAPGDKLFQHFGFNVPNIVNTAKKMLSK